MKENPETEREKEIERLDIECAMYGCWNVMQVVVKNPTGGHDSRFPFSSFPNCSGVCLEHVNGQPILMVLET